MGLFDLWMESLDYEFQILKTCSRYQSPFSSCTKCLDSCEMNAIVLEDGKPVIQPNQCTECGDCIAECPVQAVEGFYPKRRIIEHVFLAEEKPPSIKEMLGYYQTRVTSVYFHNKELSEEWRRFLNEINSKLEQLNEEALVIQFNLQKQDNKMTRREVFSFLKKGAASTVRQMAPAKWRFNHQNLELAHSFKEYQFKEIELDESKCTLCKACEMLCRKNCFHFSETELAITAQTCTGCMLCADICQEKALTITDNIQRASTRVHHLYQKECASCHAAFTSASLVEEECVRCKKMKQYDSFLG
ncbi:4Fe-4S dicluster domain-containing protein [Cytobacillus gottheilii]|uniref:4Fe-4S dicluster domain-containing protein n=1 Tax=Cytobacillus gottheilii TaxID=859144 RepID=UPI0008355652|nr:4Fe-4S dicluster domain-containing protein [Cytobacillus gottheilii]